MLDDTYVRFFFPFNYTDFSGINSRTLMLDIRKDKFVVICNECQENIVNKYAKSFGKFKRSSLHFIDGSYGQNQVLASYFTLGKKRKQLPNFMLKFLLLYIGK